MSALKEKRMSAQELSDAVANGCGWISVMTRLAPELIPTLERKNFHVDCHVHGGEKDLRALPDFDVRGKLICTCQPKGMGPFNYLMLSGVASDFNHAYELIADAAGLGNGKIPTLVSKPNPRPKVEPLNDDKTETAKIKRGLNLMARGSVNMLDPNSHLIRMYYRKRGMPVTNSPALRFHPSLKAPGGKSSAILATVKSADGTPVTFHRTFITPEGEKAFGDQSKMLYPVADAEGFKGAAIRLYETEGDTLDLTEGVETANAVHHIDFQSVWACISTSMLEQVIVPKQYKNVRIWVDRDPRIANRKVRVKPALIESLAQRMLAGEKIGMEDLGMSTSVAEQPLGPGLSSALRLAFRLISEGKKVELLMPAGSPDDKLDWEDVVLRNDLLKVDITKRYHKAKALACNQVLRLIDS